MKKPLTLNGVELTQDKSYTVVCKFSYLNNSSCHIYDGCRLIGKYPIFISNGREDVKFYCDGCDPLRDASGYVQEKKILTIMTDEEAREKLLG